MYECMYVSIYVCMLINCYGPSLFLLLFSPTNKQIPPRPPINLADVEDRPPIVTQTLPPVTSSAMAAAAASTHHTSIDLKNNPSVPSSSVATTTQSLSSPTSTSLEQTLSGFVIYTSVLSFTDKVR